jgi:hypothetical protein
MRGNKDKRCGIELEEMFVEIKLELKVDIINALDLQRLIIGQALASSGPKHWDLSNKIGY